MASGYWLMLCRVVLFVAYSQGDKKGREGIFVSVSAVIIKWPIQLTNYPILLQQA